MSSFLKVIEIFTGIHTEYVSGEKVNTDSYKKSEIVRNLVDFMFKICVECTLVLRTLKMLRS